MGTTCGDPLRSWVDRRGKVIAEYLLAVWHVLLLEVRLTHSRDIAKMLKEPHMATPLVYVNY